MILESISHSGADGILAIRPDGYSYGFNGMEGDDEVKGEGNSYDFGARFYDPRVGRFLSLDPARRLYSSVSPYNFAANNPLTNIDVNGEGPIYVINKLQIWFDGVNNEINISMDIDVIINVDMVNLSKENYDPMFGSNLARTNESVADALLAGKTLKNSIKFAPKDDDPQALLRFVLEEFGGMLDDATRTNMENHLNDSKEDWDSRTYEIHMDADVSVNYSWKKKMSGVKRRNFVQFIVDDAGTGTDDNDESISKDRAGYGMVDGPLSLVERGYEAAEDISINTKHGVVEKERRNTPIHELGHNLGQNHVDGNGWVMSEYGQSWTVSNNLKMTIVNKAISTFINSRYTKRANNAYKVSGNKFYRDDSKYTDDESIDKFLGTSGIDKSKQTR